MSRLMGLSEHEEAIGFIPKDKKHLGNFANLFFISHKKNENTLNCYSAIIYKIFDKKISLADIKIKVGEKDVEHCFWLKKGIKLFSGYRINFQKIKIHREDYAGGKVYNKITMVARTRAGKPAKPKTSTVNYSIFKTKYRYGKPHIFAENKTTMCFRQSIHNKLQLMVREDQKSDLLKNRIKIKIARVIALAYKRKNIIMLFEKFGCRFEESGSILYKKLIDLGYENAYFVLDEDTQYYANIEKKYKNNILKKGTLKHYIYFFASRTFLGSEIIGHAIDFRFANRAVRMKIESKELTYVFLQHGIMYMLANVGDRKNFRVKGVSKNRIVCSSYLEAEHIKEDLNYQDEEIYVCGLPKYDANKIDENNNKITIMPTWRKWEYNRMKENPQETEYYKMIERIVENIPENLKENIVILPHPIFMNLLDLKKIDSRGNGIEKYIPSNPIYDEILQETKVLITDYSSIAYDAFYRGSNVVFCWEEKEACLKKYGKTTKLMINEDNTFGDIVYDGDDLTEAVKNNYYCEQNPKYRENYKKIVEFDDGKNTERLIEMLKKDGIIG